MCKCECKKQPGAVDRLIGYGALTAGLVGLLAVSSWLTPYDSTDPVGGGRSGLGLRIDHFTGCHYLTGLGGITPRLDASGRQICSGPEGGDDAAWEDSRGPVEVPDA